MDCSTCCCVGAAPAVAPADFEHLYDSRNDASDKVVEVIVSTLRTKLAQCGLDELIVTRRGFGYILP